MRLVDAAFGVVVVAAGLLCATPSAWSVRPDDSTIGTLPGDEAYAKGLEAFDSERWQDVIDLMSDVVREKPWHDNAFSLLGFAHRKLGDFDRSLAFYDKALTLNPHNREALEYLGEAYLDMGQPERTEEILATLVVECQRVAASFTDGDWRTGCEEWIHLRAAYQAHLAGEGDAPQR
jgi:cytochrome c-type biogenesis protein CcmH/NrfG